MIPADFGESPAGCGDAPARAGAVRADRRETPACAGRVRDVPEKRGYVAAEFGQLTENVGRVPEERGGVTEEVRLMAKELRGCTVAKILPEIFMRFPTRFEFMRGEKSSDDCLRKIRVSSVAKIFSRQFYFSAPAKMV